MKKNIILALLSLVLALAFGELFLRVVGADRGHFDKKPRAGWTAFPERVWTGYHPILGWYPQKNRTATLEAPYFPTVHIHTNSLGMRGVREYSPQKPRGVTRVAVIGDSFVFGYGVQDSESFSAVLEARNKNLEVLNFGVPGYGLDQMLLAYRIAVKPFNSDIVIIGIFRQVFLRATRSFAETGYGKPYFFLNKGGELILRNVPVPPPFSRTAGQYPSLFEENDRWDRLKKSVLYRTLQKRAVDLAGKLGLTDPEGADEWLISRAILHQLLLEVRSDGAMPVLLLIPAPEDVLIERGSPLENSLFLFAKRERVEVIDLMPAFKQPEQGVLKNYIPGDWHWNPAGHRLASQLIEPYLSRPKASTEPQKPGDGSL